MFIGKVVGNVVCTKKDERLKGIKLLVVQMQTPDGRDKGGFKVALDGVGIAGAGERVYLSKGREASLPFGAAPPTDLTVVGVIDTINLPKE